MILNYTPHTITLDIDGTRMDFPSVGVARVSVSQQQTGNIEGAPVFRNVYGEVTGLPDPQEGTLFIVSGMVLQAIGYERLDVIAPDSGANAIRENGQIVAVKGWVIL